MTEKRVLIALVSHKPLVDFRTMLSIEGAVPGLMMMGWREQRLPHIGCADLPGARNVVFAEAYTHGFDKLIFIDADMSWEPGALERLVAHEQDLVVGAYRAKLMDEEERYNLRTLPGPARFIDPDTGADQLFGLYEISAGATGFMSISRTCMDRMVDAYGDRWYNAPNTTEGKAWSLFEFSVTDHERTGEDFHFCDLWRTIGGRIWCDPHLIMHHHGDATWSGCYADYLKRTGRFEVQADAAE